MAHQNPARSAYSRVFLIDSRARPDHTPAFQSCMRAGTVEQSFGDIERIECPDVDNYGLFDEIGFIQGAIERATSSLIGRYASDLASDLLRIAKRRCTSDIQVHFGVCTDPKSFNTFTKALIFENVSLTNWSVDDLGALSSDENAVINETVDLSIDEVIEILPMAFFTRASDLLFNEAVDVVICDIQGCGTECEDESTGCEKIYVLVGGITGSPGTPPDIIYSTDKGATWAIDEITSLLATESANALACLGDYLVVVSNDSNSLEWKLRALVDDGTAFNWTEVAAFVVTGEPNDIWSVGSYAFVVGDGGYIYGLSDPTAAATVLDAGVAVTDNLNAVHALDDQFVVAVGDNDAVVWAQDGATFAAGTGALGGNNLQSIWIKSELEWYVTDDNGDIYYSLDQGTTWTIGPAVPGGADILHDIQFASNSVGYVCGSLGGVGTIWRTYSSGNTWVTMPDGIGIVPAAIDLNALAACEFDENFVVTVGEGAVADDGIIITGSD
jgi:hypothetical protein